MPTIEERALALINEDRELTGNRQLELTDSLLAMPAWKTLYRTLEALDAERAAHAQFRQEVSDAVELDKANYEGLCFPRLSRFILAKPDPLVEVQNLLDDGLTLEEAVGNLGLKLVEVGDAD